MSPEEKSLVYGIWVVGAAVVGATCVLIRLSFKLGAKDAQQAAMAERFEKVVLILEEFSKVQVLVGFLQKEVDAIKGTTGKMASYIRELKEKWAKQEGREEARSNPDFDGEE